MPNKTNTRFFRLSAFISIVALLASCASASFQAYEGKPLPAEEIATIKSPVFRHDPTRTESLDILTINDFEIENTKKIELPPGETTFAYKYNNQTRASGTAWSMLMLLTGILPGGIIMGITYGIADAINPVHTFTTNLEAGKHYMIEFNSPHYDKNDVTAWVVEVDEAGNPIQSMEATETAEAAGSIEGVQSVEIHATESFENGDTGQ